MKVAGIDQGRGDTADSEIRSTLDSFLNVHLRKPQSGITRPHFHLAKTIHRYLPLVLYQTEIKI